MKLNKVSADNFPLRVTFSNASPTSHGNISEREMEEHDKTNHVFHSGNKLLINIHHHLTFSSKHFLIYYIQGGLIRQHPPIMEAPYLYQVKHYCPNALSDSTGFFSGLINTLFTASHSSPLLGYTIRCLFIFIDFLKNDNRYYVRIDFCPCRNKYVNLTYSLR